MTSRGRQPETAVEVGCRLPAELFGVIASFLAGDLALGTIASLNVANKDIQACTLPVLYETVTIEDLSLYIARGPPPKVIRAVPSGFRYTKFLFISLMALDMCDEPPVWLCGTLFPNLVLWTHDLLHANRCSIQVFKPVNITTVLEDIAKPLEIRSSQRWSTVPFSKFSQWHLILTLEEQGRLLLDECEETRSRYRPPKNLTNFRIYFRTSYGLRSFWSFRTWWGRRSRIPLTTIELIFGDGNTDSTCWLDVRYGSRIYLALHRDEMDCFFKLLAETLPNGPMRLDGYPNVIVHQGYVNLSSKYTRDDIRASCVKEGLATIVPQDEDNSLKIAIPKPSSTQETFSITLVG